GSWHTMMAKGAVAMTPVSMGGVTNPAGVTQYVDGVAGNFQFGNTLSVLSTTPFVAIMGFTTSINLANAVDYDDFWFFPAQVPDAWIPQINTFKNSFPFSLWPRVKIQG